MSSSIAKEDAHLDLLRNDDRFQKERLADAASVGKYDDDDASDVDSAVVEDEDDGRVAALFERLQVTPPSTKEEMIGNRRRGRFLKRTAMKLSSSSATAAAAASFGDDEEPGVRSRLWQRRERKPMKKKSKSRDKSFFRPSKLSKIVSQLTSASELDVARVRRTTEPSSFECFSSNVEGLGAAKQSSSLSSLNVPSASQAGKNELSRSLQDLSECCRVFETFSISSSSLKKSRGRKHRNKTKKDSASVLSSDAAPSPAEAGSASAARSMPEQVSCAQQARANTAECSNNDYVDMAMDDLVDMWMFVLPKKMSDMAEMMYT